MMKPGYLQTLGFVDAALEVSRVEGVLDVEELVHFSAGRHLEAWFRIFQKNYNLEQNRQKKCNDLRKVKHWKLNLV